MSHNASALTFHTRADFRRWLEKNAGVSDGVWLVLSKSDKVQTLTAQEALEEALCFGWIDSTMKRIDDDTYKKYFARRRPKSNWSERNKSLIPRLRKEGRMTLLGEAAIHNAKTNGMWEQTKEKEGDVVATFVEKLNGYSPAKENYLAMSPSVQRTYARRYFSFKTDEARERDFLKIIERLNQNLKPM